MAENQKYAQTFHNLAQVSAPSAGCMITPALTDMFTSDTFTVAEIYSMCHSFNYFIHNSPCFNCVDPGLTPINCSFLLIQSIVLSEQQYRVRLSSSFLGPLKHHQWGALSGRRILPQGSKRTIVSEDVISLLNPHL